MSELDADTDVTDRGAGRFTVDVSGRWNVGERPNGGYLTAVVARAMAAAVERPDPLTVTTHYLRPPEIGSAHVDVEVVRAGHTHATVQGRLEQGGGERLRALAVFGDLDAPAVRSAPVLQAAEPPALLPLDDCVAGERTIELNDRFDVRYDPRTVGWARGEPSGVGEVMAWLRFADGREPDPLALLLVVDALPPTAFSLGITGWVPTLELTTHVRRRPAAGWLRVAVRTRLVAGGYLDEDAEVWDAQDRLVAMSRQLALVPRAR